MSDQPLPHFRNLHAWAKANLRAHGTVPSFDIHNSIQPVEVLSDASGLVSLAAQPIVAAMQLIRTPTAGEFAIVQYRATCDAYVIMGETITGGASRWWYGRAIADAIENDRLSVNQFVRIVGADAPLGIFEVGDTAGLPSSVMAFSGTGIPGLLPLYLRPGDVFAIGHATVSTTISALIGVLELPPS